METSHSMRRILFRLFFMISVFAQAAFTEFYCRAADGSNLNAGSTNAAAASFTYASGSWVASTGVFTVASGNPSSDGVAVGDFASVYPDGSTVGVFVGRVTARDTTTITVSLTAKSGTAPTDGTNTRTLKIGGAWKGPNAAEIFPGAFVAGTMTNAAGDVVCVNMKNGTSYAVTASIAHTVAGPVRWEGFTTTAHDGGMAVIDGGVAGASYSLLNTTTSTFNEWVNIIFQNNGLTGCASMVTASGTGRFFRCVFTGSRGNGAAIGVAVFFEECEFYGNNLSNTANTGGLAGGGSMIFIFKCIFHDNAGSNNLGVAYSGGSGIMVIEQCIFDTNGNDGIRMSGLGGIMRISHSDFYNNVGSGINSAAGAGTSMLILENCNFVKNGGWGINRSGSSLMVGAFRNLGFGAGTQANVSGNIAAGISGVDTINTVNYVADVTPWVDPANGDFRISLATAKGTGRGAFTQTAAGYTGTIGYFDVGAAQHKDSGGGLNWPSFMPKLKLK